MNVYASKFILFIAPIWITLLAEGGAEFKENRYTAEHGIQGYVIQIPLNDTRLNYFLNGGKTELHRRFERENGLRDDYDVLGNLKKVLQKRSTTLEERKTSAIGPRNQGRSIRQVENYVVYDDDINYIESSPEPLEKTDYFVPCKPYSQILPVSSLANDTQTYFYPYCMDVPVCQGCCGHRDCRFDERESKSYYYKTWLGDMENRVPIPHIRSFTITYDKTCVSECDQTPKDCSAKQHYDRDLCRCSCGEHSDCNTKTHFWSESDCRCICHEFLRRDCGYGYYFAHGDCDCHRGFFDKYPTVVPIKKKPKG